MARLAFFIEPLAIYLRLYMSFLEAFVLDYQLLAYLILFAGMFIEGEIFILTALVFAWQGLMEWEVIVPITFVGVILGDLAWYALGRFSKGSKIGLWAERKFPGYHDWMDVNFVGRYTRMAIFSKFLYFVNRLTPLIAGWHKMELKRFLKIHFIAAVLWLGTMLFIGHFLGAFIELIGPHKVLRNMGYLVLGLVVVFIGGEYLLKTIFSKRLKKEAGK